MLLPKFSNNQISQTAGTNRTVTDKLSREFFTNYKQTVSTTTHITSSRHCIYSTKTHHFFKTNPLSS